MCSGEYKSILDNSCEKPYTKREKEAAIAFTKDSPYYEENPTSCFNNYCGSGLDSLRFTNFEIGERVIYKKDLEEYLKNGGILEISSAYELSNGTLYVYHNKNKSWGKLEDFVSYISVESFIRDREKYDLEMKIRKIVEESYEIKFQELIKRVEQLEQQYTIKDSKPQLNSECALEPLTTTNKICSCCGETKPYSEFFKRSKGSKDGYNAQCKFCCSSKNLFSH